jgi:hypothetical protein
MISYIHIPSHGYDEDPADSYTYLITFIHACMEDATEELVTVICLPACLPACLHGS